MRDDIDVLIVDDDRDLAMVVQQLLSDLSLTVALAVNGREGYQKAVELRPRLIISDVMMPIMRGDDMLSALRENDETADIPCILMTSAPSMVRTPAPKVIPKPFDLAQLESLVTSHLAGQ